MKYKSISNFGLDLFKKIYEKSQILSKIIENRKQLENLNKREKK